MTAHTPGPWRSAMVQPHSVERGDVSIDMKGRPRCFSIWHTYRDAQERRCHQPIADVHVVAGHQDEAEVNARLIAAAPGLLEALKLLVADVQDYEAWQRPCHALDVARAIIARAEGAAP